MSQQTSEMFWTVKNNQQIPETLKNLKTVNWYAPSYLPQHRHSQLLGHVMIEKSIQPLKLGAEWFSLFNTEHQPVCGMYPAHVAVDYLAIGAQPTCLAVKIRSNRLKKARTYLDWR